MQTAESKTLHYEKIIKKFFEKTKDEKGNNFFSFKFIDSNDDIWKEPNALDSNFRAVNGLRKWSAYGRYDFLLFCKPANEPEQFVNADIFFDRFESEKKLYYNDSNTYRLKELSEDLEELKKNGRIKKSSISFSVDILYILLYSREEKIGIALSAQQLENIKFNSLPREISSTLSEDLEGYIDDDYIFLNSMYDYNPHNQ